MADINKPTQDVTLFSEDGSRGMDVNTDKEGLVHDQDVLDQLRNLTISLAWQTYCLLDKGFGITHEATLGNSAEYDIILLINPTGSGMSIRIKEILFGIQTPSTDLTFKIYRNPTITSNGTTLTGKSFHTQSAVPVAQSFHTPTISNRGTKFSQFDMNSSGVGTLLDDEELALIVDEGDTILITAKVTSSNKTFSVNVSWAEDDSQP